MLRLQFRLSDSAERVFNDITKKLETSDKETVLDALGLMYFAINEIENGRRVGSFDPERREFTSFASAALQSLKARVAQRAPVYQAAAAAARSSG